jgi:hypothetical protein
MQMIEPRVEDAFFLGEDGRLAGPLLSILRNQVQRSEEAPLCLVLVDRAGLHVTLMIDGAWIATARALERFVGGADLGMELPSTALTAVAWGWPQDCSALGDEVELAVDLVAGGIAHLSFHATEDNEPQAGTGGRARQ